MSKPAATIGAKLIPEASYQPTNIIEGSSDVMVNGKPVVTFGCKAAMHMRTTTPQNPHEPVVTEGSSTVLVNGKPVSRMGDKCMMGEIIGEGSSDVFIGG